MSKDLPNTNTGGYQVDVSALEKAVTQLNTVATNLGPVCDRAAYNTTIGTGTLGTGFDGATGFRNTHDTMQSWIAEMVGALQNFIEEYSGQTKQVAANYTDLEDQTARNLS